MKRPISSSRFLARRRDIAGPVTKPQFAGRPALTAGLTGGVIAAVLSSLINFVVVGMPDSSTANAFNHGMTGLISGFTAGFFGLRRHLRKAPPKPRAHGYGEKGEGTAP